MAKSLNHSARIIISAVFLLLTVASQVRAAPVIASYSSTGGTTQNKDNEQDIMYLVQQGDTITFSITASGATSYKWFANKVDQNVDSAIFTWTVPSKKDTWEIRVEASDDSGMAPKEWVVSTLSLAEAPVIFDYFSDGKLSGRAEKDPWERNQPEWNIFKAWDAAAGEAKTDDGTISVPSDITVGTWKLRYRYLSAPPTADYSRGTNFTFIKKSNGSSLYVQNPTDGHWWLDYWASGEINDPDNWPRASHSYPYINMVGSQISGSLISGDESHEVVFIRDDQGYVGTWLDGKFVQWSRDRNTDITENTLFSISGYNLSGYTVAYDNVEIYRGVFLIPNGGVSYGAGLITVNDYDVTLERIAQAINDPSVFIFDEENNTAVSYADILVKSGAGLNVKNVDFKITGGKKLMYEREAMIFIENATITSTNSASWNWQISGPTSYPAVVLSIADSHLDNFGGFSATGMKTLYIKNSRFTNLVGTNPFSISFRRPPNGELLISGSLFQGKTGSETIYFQGGDQFHQLKPEPYGMDIVNTVFENIKLFRQYDWPYYLSPGRPGGTANLINSQVTSLEYSGSTYRFKYYLDVKVVDTAGNPVSGATVTVTNEQDNANYPAENLIREWKYLKVEDQVSASGEDYFTGQQGNWFKGLVDVNDHPSALTGSDGHTPLPSNATGTLIVTGKKNNDSYTYTVKAGKNGLTGEVNNVSPNETWYRSDPNVYQNTITIVLSNPASVPTAPLNLQALPGDKSAFLSWQAPSSDGGSSVTNYRIYRGTSSGGQTFLVELENVLNFTDKGLTNEQTYYYKLSAKNYVGEGSQSGEASVTPSGPTSYWKFDEGTGTVALDSIGSNNGSLINGPVWVDGKAGKALQFDGSDDYVLTSAPSAVITGDWSIEGWINPTTGDITENHFFGNAGIQAWVLDGRVYFLCGGDYSDFPSISYGAWSHIVLTKTSSGHYAYINGILKGSGAGTCSLASGGFKMGSYSDGSYNFNGLIDEVRIYNRALSAAEILADYQAVDSVAIDLNQDGTINILDIVMVAQHFGETTASPYPSYDVNSDGSVNIIDIRLVAEGM